MINVPVKNLLGIWVDLYTAYEGTNGCGGHTCEIYAYRFYNYSPILNGFPIKDQPEAQKQCAESLYNTLMFFQQEYTDAAIYVEGTVLGEWIKDILYDHRIHITIEKKKR